MYLPLYDMVTPSSFESEEPKHKCPHWGSNPGPIAYKAIALPTGALRASGSLANRNRTGDLGRFTNIVYRYNYNPL